MSLGNGTRSFANVYDPPDSIAPQVVSTRTVGIGGVGVGEVDGAAGLLPCPPQVVPKAPSIRSSHVTTNRRATDARTGRRTFLSVNVDLKPDARCGCWHESNPPRPKRDSQTSSATFRNRKQNIARV